VPIPVMRCWHTTDMGIAWDGDFDRCFLFDETGEFIEGYYIVGLLAEAFLQQHQGAKIIHDPRLTWNTIDVVEAAGGVPIQSKTGHAFIKERMRLEDAIYGGEMSAHHYFRDFAYCDSGMIPWLLVAQLMSVKGQTLSTLVSERIGKFPCSGEINFHVNDVKACIAAVREHFAALQPLVIDTTDGLSMEFAEWRFNLRGSNTEPVLRLNVESRQDMALVQEQVANISSFKSAGAVREPPLHSASTLLPTLNLFHKCPINVEIGKNLQGKWRIHAIHGWAAVFSRLIQGIHHDPAFGGMHNPILPHAVLFIQPSFGVHILERGGG